MELVNGRNEEVIRLGKHKLFRQTSVDEDSVDARRTQVSCRVELPAASCGEHRVHIHVMKGVWCSGKTVAEPFVNGPHPHTNRNLLVVFRRVFLVR